MKILISLLLLLFQTGLILGQVDYHVIDSMRIIGDNLIDGGSKQNATQCQVLKNGETIVFTPDIVKEYGFKDGRIYFSRDITIHNEERKVFLEMLNKGKVNLYFYKDKKKGNIFFIEKDVGHLVEIFKNNDSLTYKELLNIYVEDCENISDALKLVAFNKPSLSKFFDQYNSCTLKPFPFIKYGLIIGYGTTKIVSLKSYNEELRNALFKKDKSFNFGIFFDIPILLSSFTLHPEIYYQQDAFSSHSVSANMANDILINTTSINLPVLIRYTYPSVKYHPFINLGTTFAYNIRNEFDSYSSTISNQIVEIEKLNLTTIIPDKQIGLSFGGGIQYNIDYRKSLFFELRYNTTFGIPKETFRNNRFQFLVGINL
jgi:Outer membrane protein beta-barrel domain